MRLIANQRTVGDDGSAYLPSIKAQLGELRRAVTRIAHGAARPAPNKLSVCCLVDRAATLAEVRAWLADYGQVQGVVAFDAAGLGREFPAARLLPAGLGYPEALQYVAEQCGGSWVMPIGVGQRIEGIGEFGTLLEIAERVGAQVIYGENLIPVAFSASCRVLENGAVVHDRNIVLWTNLLRVTGRAPVFAAPVTSDPETDAYLSQAWLWLARVPPEIAAAPCAAIISGTGAAAQCRVIRADKA